jgi:hypothetical protein
MFMNRRFDYFIKHRSLEIPDRKQKNKNKKIRAAARHSSQTTFSG